MPEAKIPFDGAVLQAVCSELRTLEGEHVEKISQSDEYTFIIKLGRAARARRLLLSCHPEFFRAHFATSESAPYPREGFGNLLHDRVGGARLLQVEQIGFDRRAEFVFAKGPHHYTLSCAFYGSRSNIVLRADEAILGRARKIRDVPSAHAADARTAIESGEGISPFLKREIEIRGADEVLRLLSSPAPVLIEGAGAYPFQPAQLPAGKAHQSMSRALELHYLHVLPEALARQKAASLRGQLEHALDASKVALRQISDVLDTAKRAADLQMRGELVLAHLHEIPEGARGFETQDYEGNLIAIELNPRKDPKHSAERLFSKAKRAKAAAKELGAKAQRLDEEVARLETLLNDLAGLENIEGIEAEAKRKGWLREMREPTRTDDEKPFQGHKIRTAEAPRGYAVLWGENARANDYLISKIAKPNDYWLHVRGGMGAHVVLQTNNQPHRIQPDVLAFAALIAARNSNQKHAAHVPVTYTLAKYVRKPRKSAPGAVTFTNDRTLFVDP